MFEKIHPIIEVLFYRNFKHLEVRQLLFGIDMLWNTLSHVWYNTQIRVWLNAAMMSFIYFRSMGFCLLIVCGLNRLSSFARSDRTIFNKDKTKGTHCDNGQRKKASTFSEASSTTKLLQKASLLVFFMLTGLFCWKVIVRNRVWRNRESLFRWILMFFHEYFSWYK